ncbi:hypothetical protein TNCV_1568551 [Trichonephila clavipes]|nr:hypothetical protein TNCV_1568551 [Trichonephila clavipes]
MGLKYPKVLAFFYGTTHQNVINCSSVDWKRLRDFLGVVRSATDLGREHNVEVGHPRSGTLQPPRKAIKRQQSYRDHQEEIRQQGGNSI